MLATNRGGVDQAEVVGLLLVAGTNVGADARAGQAIDCFDQGVIVFAGRAAIGEYQ